jgi:hypothetical protein
MKLRLFIGQGRGGALVASTLMKAAIAGRKREHKGPPPAPKPNQAERNRRTALRSVLEKAALARQKENKK